MKIIDAVSCLNNMTGVECIKKISFAYVRNARR